MNSFVSKPILTSQTIGERFKKAREGAGWSLHTVARATGIRKHYLACIESGHYTELPGEIYTTAFIKKYARLLRMDSWRVLEAYAVEKREQHPHERTSTVLKPKKSLLRAPVIGKALVISAVLGVVIYGFTLINTLLGAPQIEITTPAKYSESSSSRIVLRGSIHKAEELFLNGAPLALEPDGSFAESFTLSAGTYLFHLTARGRLGKEVTEYRKVVITNS
jgi:cytoskeletal protein RodZ